MLTYGLDSNVTKLLSNLLTKTTDFSILPNVHCNIASIKIIITVIITVLSGLIYFYSLRPSLIGEKLWKEVNERK